MVTSRTAKNVFERHLALQAEGDLERDIAENYAVDVRVLTNHGLFMGHDGVRQCARILAGLILDADFELRFKTVAGRVAYVTWTGRSPDSEVCRGTDTFIIEDGRITVQTIYYTIDGNGKY